MNALILAADAHHMDPPGDDLATVAYIALGVTMLVAAVATWIVTPKGDPHH